MAAYLSARNDAITNISIIAVGILTIFWPSSVFDIAVGVGIGLLNSTPRLKFGVAPSRLIKVSDYCAGNR